MTIDSFTRIATNYYVKSFEKDYTNSIFKKDFDIK